MSAPWSLKVIDDLPMHPSTKHQLRIWIIGDRIMWVGATAFVMSFGGLILFSIFK